MPVVVLTTTGAGNWTVPAGITTLQVECWGSGAAGISFYVGGGGAYSKKNALAVTPGASIPYFIGSGNPRGGNPSDYDGQDTWFGSTSTVLAKAGKLSYSSATNGGDAALGVGDVKFSGGRGQYAGGGSASPYGNGQAAGNNNFGETPTPTLSGSAGGYSTGAGAGASSSSMDGVSNVDGGGGGWGGTPQTSGGAPGGGGGGGSSTGGRGQIRITYTIPINHNVAWNPADKNAAVTLSNSNTTATHVGAWSYTGVRGTVGYNSGLYYFEALVPDGAGSEGAVGVANKNAPLNDSLGYSNGDSIGFYPDGNAWKNGEASSANPGGTFGGKRVGFLVNVTTRRMWIKNDAGVWVMGGNPASGGIGLDISSITGALYPMVTLYFSDETSTIYSNPETITLGLPAGASFWGTAPAPEPTPTRKAPRNSYIA